MSRRQAWGPAPDVLCPYCANQEYGTTSLKWGGNQVELKSDGRLLCHTCDIFFTWEQAARKVLWRCFNVDPDQAVSHKDGIE